MILYHAAPILSREAISHEGLRGADIGTGNYEVAGANFMFGHEDDARRYVEYLDQVWNEDAEVWQVNVADLDIRPDNVWAREDKEGEYGPAWYVVADIPPDRLELLG